MRRSRLSGSEGSSGFGPLMGKPHRNSSQSLKGNAAEGSFIGALVTRNKDRNGVFGRTHGMAFIYHF